MTDIDGAPKPDGTPLLPPIPRRHVFKKRSIGTVRERRKLIGRIMRAAERHVKDIEDRLEIAGIVPTERESDTRALAVLACTMRELAAIDERDVSRKGPSKSGAANDQPIPLDIDELRRSLARKMEALIAEQQGEVPGVADA